MVLSTLVSIQDIKHQEQNEGLCNSEHHMTKKNIYLLKLFILVWQIIKQMGRHSQSIYCALHNVMW